MTISSLPQEVLCPSVYHGPTIPSVHGGSYYKGAHRRSLQELGSAQNHLLLLIFSYRLQSELLFLLSLQLLLLVLVAEPRTIQPPHVSPGFQQRLGQGQPAEACRDVGHAAAFAVHGPQIGAGLQQLPDGLLGCAERLLLSDSQVVSLCKYANLLCIYFYLIFCFIYLSIYLFYLY